MQNEYHHLPEYDLPTHLHTYVDGRVLQKQRPTRNTTFYFPTDNRHLRKEKYTKQTYHGQGARRHAEES